MRIRGSNWNPTQVEFVKIGIYEWFIRYKLNPAKSLKLLRLISTVRQKVPGLTARDPLNPDMQSY